MSQTDVTTLKTVPLFANMDEAEIVGLRAVMDEARFVPGQTIIRDGEPGEHFYVILEGTVQFLTSDADGREIALDQAGPGGFFGELSMLTGEPRTVRVRAVTAVNTLALDRQEFHDFLIKHPHAGIDVLTAISRRLYRTDSILRQSVSKSANDVADERATIGQKIADTFAAMMGSWGFIIVQSTILAVWVMWNVIADAHNQRHPDSHWFVWDAYPFIFLNLALSFQAAYAAPIIMMSQNRSADKDRMSAEIDHQVNIKAEVKTGLIVARLDELERAMHLLHAEQLALLKQHGLPAPPSAP